MTTFKEALFLNDLIQFLLPSGQVLTRRTCLIDRPPSQAKGWRVDDDGEWITDMGGQWLETGEGKMIWRERAS